MASLISFVSRLFWTVNEPKESPVTAQVTPNAMDTSVQQSSAQVTDSNPPVSTPNPTARRHPRKRKRCENMSWCVNSLTPEKQECNWKGQICKDCLKEMIDEELRRKKKMKIETREDVKKKTYNF